MKWLAIVGAALSLLVCSVGDAAATSCDDITPGGQMGPEVPEGPYNHAFTLDFEDACFVQWEGGTRGEAGRQEDRAKCESLAGAEMLQFVPDGGSNFNLCVYRIVASGDEGASADGEAAAPDELFGDVQLIPDSQSGGSGANAESVAPSQASQSQGGDNGSYTLQICNGTSESVSVAVGLYENSEDSYQTIQGWWVIAPDACEEWSRALGRYSSHVVYYHAESGTGSWGNTTQLCVANTAFTRLLSAGYLCGDGERLVDFSEVEVKQGLKAINLTE